MKYHTVKGGHALFSSRAIAVRPFQKGAECRIHAAIILSRWMFTRLLFATLLLFALFKKANRALRYSAIFGPLADFIILSALLGMNGTGRG